MTPEPLRPEWSLNSRAIPHPQLYPLGDFARSPAEAAFISISEVLQEFVGFGCWAISWVLDDSEARTTQGSLDEANGTSRAVAVGFFRSLLDSIDGLSILVAAGSGDQSVVLLRSTLESVMRLEYLLADDSVRRAYAFLTCRLHDRLKFLSLMDPSTAAGREFLSVRQEDILIPFGGSSPHDELARAESEVVRRQISVVGPVELVDARAEYERLAGIRNRFYWYSFWGGPASIYGLARTVKMGAVYRILYSQGSRIVHGDAAIDRLTVRVPGHLGVSQLRHPGELSYATRVGGSVCLHATKRFLEVLRPDKLGELGRFYERVRPSWRAVTSGAGCTVQNEDPRAD